MQVDRKVLEEAIAALEDSCGGRCNAEYNPCWQQEVAQTLKAALEQPEQEPVACIRTWHKGSDQHAELLDWTDALEALPDGEHHLYTHPPRKQEPLCK